MRLTTFDDLIQHTISFMSKDASQAAATDAKEAVLDAYASLATYHTWNYYRRIYRLSTNAPYSTGTVVYDHTGGAYERVLTLTSGTWPAWASYGVVQLDDTTYEVQERKSATQLVLDIASNPGADVASTYRLFRDSYPLPSDFLAIVSLSFSNSTCSPGFLYPQEFSSVRGRVNNSPGRPQGYAVIGSSDFFGSMSLCFWNAPDQAYAVDLLYTSRGRDMVVDSYREGSVSTASGSDLVTGSGTDFDSEMEGSIIRVGKSTDRKVTGNERLFRYATERTVLEVVSATSLRVDSAMPSDREDAGYVISDPVDVEQNAMLRFLKRECEKQARIKTRMKPVEGGEDMKVWKEEMNLAMAADSRYIGNRVASSPRFHPRRLQDRGSTDYQ